MGMMQGKVIGDTFIVLDSFALPVEGSRVRGAQRSAARRRALSRLRRCQARRRA
jgi:hypothetical protein